MKKIYILGFTATAILLFFTMTAISADIDGIFEVWMNQEGKMTLVSIYNEDCTECHGKEYQDRVCQLAEGGCTYCGMCYSGSFSGGGAEPLSGSYEENKFVKTVLTMNGYGDKETWVYGIFGIRSTPEGIQYYDDETDNWVDVPPEMELPIQVEDLQLQGLFDHDVKIGWWFPVGGAEITTTPTINPDGTEAQWVFDDYWVDSIHIIHAQITVDGEEVWEKKTIVYEVPDTGGLPTLEPKNYGVPVLGTKYGAHSNDEIPEELLKYTKEINGQLYTYSDSKLDIWLFENIYKPNHAKSFIQD